VRVTRAGKRRPEKEAGSPAFKRPETKTKRRKRDQGDPVLDEKMTPRQKRRGLSSKSGYSCPGDVGRREGDGRRRGEGRELVSLPEKPSGHHYRKSDLLCKPREEKLLDPFRRKRGRRDLARKGRADFIHR